MRVLSISPRSRFDAMPLVSANVPSPSLYERAMPASILSHSASAPAMPVVTSPSSRVSSTSASKPNVAIRPQAANAGAPLFSSARRWNALPTRSSRAVGVNARPRSLPPRLPGNVRVRSIDRARQRRFGTAPSKFDPADGHPWARRVGEPRVHRVQDLTRHGSAEPSEPWTRHRDASLPSRARASATDIAARTFATGDGGGWSGGGFGGGGGGWSDGGGDGRPGAASPTRIPTRGGGSAIRCA